VAEIMQSHTIQPNGVSSDTECSPECIRVDRTTVAAIEYEVSGMPRWASKQPPLVLFGAMTSQGVGEGRRQRHDTSRTLRLRRKDNEGSPGSLERPGDPDAGPVL
jgi:hypothetical protein